MNLEQIEAIIAKNLNITDQRLMDGVIEAVMDAVNAEREACALVCEQFDAENPYIGQGKACAVVIHARGEV